MVYKPVKDDNNDSIGVGFNAIQHETLTIENLEHFGGKLLADRLLYMANQLG